jgi:transcriptional regulator with XRE-family HTH domain
VIGDALRARRQAQHRTLREVSTAANVSLGYLSEIERGQKEASSELLASICEALGAQLSDVLREASQTVALEEQMDQVLAPVREVVPGMRPSQDAVVPQSRAGQRTAVAERPAMRRPDGQVSVSVRRPSPLKATLHAKHTLGRAGEPERTGRERDVVFAA